MLKQNSSPSLAPAVIVAGAVRAGEVGNSHDDILSRLPDYPRNTLDRSIERGFVTETGNFLSRHEAFRYAQKHKLLNDDMIDGEDELHSEHLG